MTIPEPSSNNDIQLKLMNKRKELEQQIIAKAMKDPAFRRDLTEQPGDVISRETGVQIPDSVRIRVLEETPGTFFLVLPSPVIIPKGDELTENELSTIAAGGLESEFWDHFYTRLNRIF